MGAIRDYIESMSWSQNDWVDFRVAPARFDLTSMSQDDVVDAVVFLKGGINAFSPVSAEGQEAQRFFPKEKTSVSEVDIEQRANNARHPYTRALIFDYLHHVRSKGQKAKRDAGVAAGHSYIDSLIHFAAADNPEDFWMAASDAVSRGKECLVAYKESIDYLIDATIAYLHKIPSHRGVLIARQLAIALTRGIGKRSASQAKLDEAFHAFWERVTDAKKNAVLLAKSLEQLGRLAKITDVGRRIAELMNDCALSHGVSGEPLLATASIHEAARWARSHAGELMGPLLKAQELLRSPVAASLDQVQVLSGQIDLSFLHPVITKLSNANSPEHALMLLGSMRGFVPSKSDIIASVNAAGPSLVEQIVGIQPLGEHGPSGQSMHQVRIHQTTDIQLHKAAMILRHGLYKEPHLARVFSQDVVAEHLVDSGVIFETQREILIRGIRAWAECDFMAANSILIPLTENAFVHCCSLLGGSSLVISRSESTSRRTGDSIVALIAEHMDEDWAYFFDFLFAREGAIRHAYCHGYVASTQIQSREADLCIFFLLALAFSIISKMVYDEHVRQSAYFLWESRGRPDGDSWRDWFDAECQL